MKTLKNNILFIIIIILILLVVWFHLKNQRMQADMYNKIQEANKELVKLDKIKKESDGQYSKLVNYFSDQRTLNSDLRDRNKELSKLIKKQGERILMLNNSVISLEGKVSKGDITIEENDSTVINLSLKYPNSSNSFINWDGKIFTTTSSYLGNWSFKSLPIQVIMTETDRGLWKTRLVGPDWLKVDCIEVNSLPPLDFSNVKKERSLGFLLGGGYNKSLNPVINDALSISGGIYFKNHNILLNGTSNSQIGINYIYRFSNKNKNR